MKKVYVGAGVSSAIAAKFALVTKGTRGAKAALLTAALTSFLGNTKKVKAILKSIGG